MFLGGELKVIKFQFHALTRDQQVRFDLRQPTFQFRVEPFDNGLAIGPLMNVFFQRPFYAYRFTLPVVVDLPLIDPLTALPEDPAKLAKAF